MKGKYGARAAGRRERMAQEAASREAERQLEWWRRLDDAEVRATEATERLMLLSEALSEAAGLHQEVLAVEQEAAAAETETKEMRRLLRRWYKAFENDVGRAVARDESGRKHNSGGLVSRAAADVWRDMRDQEKWPAEQAEDRPPRRQVP